MVKFKLYSALALIILMLIVVLQNTQAVETHFLFVTFTMPRAALLAITFLVGMAAGLLLSFALLKHLPKKKLLLKKLALLKFARPTNSAVP